jgi:hypothetical protein
MGDPTKKTVDDMSIEELSSELEKAYQEETHEDDTKSLLRKSMDVISDLVKAKKPVDAKKKKMAKAEDENSPEDKIEDEAEDEMKDAAKADQDGDVSGADEGDLVKSLRAELDAAKTDLANSAEFQGKIGGFLDKITDAVASHMGKMEKAMARMTEHQANLEKALTSGVKSLLKAQLSSIQAMEQAPAAATPQTRTPEKSKMAQLFARNVPMQKAKTAGNGDGNGDLTDGEKVDANSPEGKLALSKAMTAGKITELDVKYAKVHGCLPMGKRLN